MKEYWKGMLAGVMCTAVVGTAGCAGLQWFTGKGLMGDPRVTDKVETIESMIEERYIEDVDEQTLEEGMYAGMVAALGDPYSRYYTSEEYDQEMTVSEGNYKGIGVVLSQEEEACTIVEVYKGGPGEEAGLLPKDIIISLNGESVEGWELSTIVSTVKSSEAPITMGILRDGKEMEFSVDVREVELTYVNTKMLDNNVGYLELTEFSGVATKQYKDGIEELKEQGMEKLIVDLRDNPGGYLDTVCDILREILPEGLIVYTEDKNGFQQQEKCDGENPLEIPLVVLVNGNSASASEIFAGAVQDYEIGTIVGTTTYGKGIVQSIQGLADGSALKLTVSHYYTPKGNDIHKIGITPDVEVEMDENGEKGEPDKDPQLQKALELLDEKENEEPATGIGA
ncbi:MAG: S41 family peptidase [Eubacteriales bacterium]|nr:S41 family peptidase [Eubacteriales bacterium]